MKILIINPPAHNTISEYPDMDGSGFLEASDFGTFPPLGPLYILSYAEKQYPEHDYHFLDCVGESLSYSQVEQRIAALKPDLIGITSFTLALIDVVKTAAIVRAVVPDAHICLGGHHAIAFPHESCMLPHFDSVIVGEGEVAFAALIHALHTQTDYTRIPGLYTRDTTPSDLEDAQATATQSGISLNCIEDLDSLPIPNRKYISHILYNSIVGQKKRLATMITSRGCPYKCTFCVVPYKRHRLRGIESVMDEIALCLEMGYEEFHFYDDLFNITPQRLVEFCNALMRRKMNIVWDFRGRVNGLTPEVLALCKSAGLRMISFGVETGSDEGLRTIRKDTTVSQIASVFRWCRELGIITVADFLIGLPHERTTADIEKNLDFLISINPDYAQINIMNLYPHTEVFKTAIEKGLIERGRWESFALNPHSDFYVDHWTEWISEEELIRLHRRAYRRFYFRPRYMLKRVVKVRSLHELQSGLRGIVKLLRVFYSAWK